MSDADELEAIRQRKRERLERRLQEGEDSTDRTDTDPGSPSSPVHVESEAEFSELVASHDVVLVDFYADWCGPCKMLEPTVEALARDSPATVAKVDVDRHQGLASQYQVQGVPTLLLFSGGDLVERVVGVRDQGTLASLVDQYAG
jgi:thioredoxin 1